MHRHSYGLCLVYQCPRYRLPDPPCRVRAKLKPFFVFKLIYGLHEAYVAFLNQIKQGKSPAYIIFCYIDHQSQIPVRQHEQGAARCRRRGRCSRRACRGRCRPWRGRLDSNRAKASVAARTNKLSLSISIGRAHHRIAEWRRRIQRPGWRRLNWLAERRSRTKWHFPQRPA